MDLIAIYDEQRGELRSFDSFGSEGTVFLNAQGGDQKGEENDGCVAKVLTRCFNFEFETITNATLLKKKEGFRGNNNCTAATTTT